MGQLVAVIRLATRDFQRRRGETFMLLVVVLTATTALTLGLVLHGVTAQPYQQTRDATAGPDVVATAFPGGSGSPSDPTGLDDVAHLAEAPGVVGSSGPFPVSFPVLRANGHADAVLAEGRDSAPAAVDQPKLTEGSWVKNDGVVVERSFADAFGVRTGDQVSLDGRPFTVVGVAVTAAVPTSGIGFLEGSTRWPNPGLVWLTENDARSFASSAAPLGYILNLRLVDAGDAEYFANRFSASGSYLDNEGNPFLIPWQEISRQDALLVRSEQSILLVGSSLLALLAIGSLAILVGGRMAEQMRRVGLLKAVGATPALVAGVLLAEYLTLSFVAAALGLVIGRLVAPQLTSPGAALLGTAGAPPLTAGTVAVVIAVALGVAVLASFLPALRAARTSTVDALADAPRRPRRRPWVIGRSTRLPVPLLLAVRLAARRPRRVMLCTFGIAVTVSGIVAVLLAHATLMAAQFGESAGSANPNLFDVGFASKNAREDQVLLVVTILLVVLAAINMIFITRAMVQDSSHTCAVTRALGATPDQLAVALSAAQVLPAMLGAIIGIPGGLELYAFASAGGTSSQLSAVLFVAVVLGTIVMVAGLTSIPARVGARTPVTEVLHSEAV